VRYVVAHAGNPGPYTGGGNYTYVLPGAVPALIDAGVGERGHLDCIARILDEESAAGRSRPGLARVLVTHAHTDHATGAPAIAARWPEAVFSKLLWPEHDRRYPVAWSRVRDGDRIAAGDGELVVLHTPGHAPDHVCFYDEADRTLYGGDLVVSGQTVVIPASHGGSLVQYLDSLRRVLELDPAVILPAHGPAIDRPGELLREYIEHRRRRDAQIRGALRTGARTIPEIVRRVYPSIAPGLTDAAGESVLAHLEKIEADGQAARDGDRWRLVRRAGRR
jgi:glyoxylase-like metal-dependent hydrolase (beta-lactamase superfamily II)